MFRIVLVAWLSLFIACTASGPAAQAGEAKVAVAANFTEPIKELAGAFEASSGHKLVLSFGATGQFYAQITQGAPFEVLLSADTATPARAIAEGHALSGTAFTYAIGKLMLYSKTAGLTLGPNVLKEAKFAKIAVANPATAPYGAAAMQVLKALDALDVVQPKIVQGSTITQTFQFVETGNAELGFVAASQLAFVEGGSRWEVSPQLYSPIAQGAVLLKAGAYNAAAKALLAFLRTPQAKATITKYGYALP